MSRHQDNSGIANTCPFIDRVIGFIESLDSEEIGASSIRDAINTLEEIRGMNQGLRDWGNELCRDKDELENDLNKEIARMESKIEDLESMIADKDHDIEELIRDLNAATL